MWTVEKLKELVVKIDSDIKKCQDAITTLKGKKIAVKP